MEQEAELPDRS